MTFPPREQSAPFRFGVSPVPRVPTAILNYLLTLPDEVRQGLGSLLLDSTAGGFDGTPETSAQLWRDELKRRCDEADAHPERSHTIEETMAYLQTHMDNLERNPRPDHTDGYHCVDYFADGWAERGYYDAESHLWVVSPFTAASDETRHGFMAVGSAGADGVCFGYRFGHTGVWAFYPVEGEFRRVATSTAELVERWKSGSITL